MDYNLIKEKVQKCSAFLGLDADTLAWLFWTGELITAAKASAIYNEGDPSDNSFGLLLDGELEVVIGGSAVGQVEEGQLFGEVAHFHKDHKRTAKVAVSTPAATYMTWTITEEDYNDPRFAGLKRGLGDAAWITVASTS